MSVMPMKVGRMFAQDENKAVDARHADALNGCASTSAAMQQ